MHNTDLSKAMRACSPLLRERGLKSPEEIRSFQEAIINEDDVKVHTLEAKSCWDNNAHRDALDNINVAVSRAPQRDDLIKAYILRAGMLFALRQDMFVLKSLRQAFDFRDDAIAPNGEMPNDNDVIEQCVRNAEDITTKDVRHAVECVLSNKKCEAMRHLGVFTWPCNIKDENIWELSRPPLADESTMSKDLFFLDHGHGEVLTANMSFQIGNLIAIDRSVCSSLIGKSVARRCDNCHNEQMWATRACHSTAFCTAQYCSRDCMEMALTEYNHEPLCRLAAILFAFEECRPIVRLATDTFRTENAVSNWKFFHLLPYEERFKKHNSLAYRSSSYLPFNYQAKLAIALRFRCTRQRSDAERFRHLRLASFIYNLLKHGTNFVFPFKNRDDRIMLRIFIHDAVIVMDEFGRDVLSVSSVRLPGEPKSMPAEPVLRGLFPLSALMRHSCTPNVAVFPCGLHQLGMYAVRPIRLKEELTIDWSHGQLTTEQLRTKNHREQQQMFARCECACETEPSDAPRRVREKDKPNWFSDSPEEQEKKLHVVDSFTVLTGFKMFVAFMHRFNHLFPCHELYEARQRFDKYACRLFGEKVQYDLSAIEVGEVQWASQSSGKRLSKTMHPDDDGPTSEDLREFVYANFPSAMQNTPEATADDNCPEGATSAHDRSSRSSRDGSLLELEMAANKADMNVLGQLRAHLGEPNRQTFTQLVTSSLSKSDTMQSIASLPLNEMSPVVVHLTPDYHSSDEELLN